MCSVKALMINGTPDVREPAVPTVHSAWMGEGGALSVDGGGRARGPLVQLEFNLPL